MNILSVGARNRARYWNFLYEAKDLRNRIITETRPSGVHPVLFCMLPIVI